MRKPALVLVLLLVQTIAGCGSPGQASQPTAKTFDMNFGLCLSLKELRTATTDVRELGADSTIGEIGEATDMLRKSVADVQRSAAGDRGQEVAALNEAFEQLSAAVAELPSDMTVTQALDTLTEERAAVQSAWTELVTSVECDPPIEP